MKTVLGLLVFCFIASCAAANDWVIYTEFNTSDCTGNGQVLYFKADICTSFHAYSTQWSCDDKSVTYSNCLKSSCKEDCSKTSFSNNQCQELGEHTSVKYECGDRPDMPSGTTKMFLIDSKTDSIAYNTFTPNKKKPCSDSTITSSQYIKQRICTYDSFGDVHSYLYCDGQSMKQVKCPDEECSSPKCEVIDVSNLLDCSNVAVVEFHQWRCPQ